MDEQPDISEEAEVTITPDHASGGDSGDTLLPMLVGGVVLVIIGAIVVMFFF